MRLRHEVFHTLAALNRVISELLQELNERPFRRGQGGQNLYEQLDKTALKALPPYRYEYVDIRRAKVGSDYHVLYSKHAYSVPHALVGSHIDIEAGARLIRLYHRGTLVAQHPRAQQQGSFTTQAEHMPESHRRQRWSPERLLSWGESIGSATRAVVAWHLHHRTHPEQAYRTCLGLLNHGWGMKRISICRNCEVRNAMAASTFREAGTLQQWRCFSRKKERSW